MRDNHSIRKNIRIYVYTIYVLYKYYTIHVYTQYTYYNHNTLNISNTLTFEKKIYKIENHFQKAEVMFLVKSAKIVNVMF